MQMGTLCCQFGLGSKLDLLLVNQDLLCWLRIRPAGRASVAVRGHAG